MGFSEEAVVNPATVTPFEFSVQSYLRHQDCKFNARFDANCYISLTRKIDTHDICRGRVNGPLSGPIAETLSQITQPSLVIGISSDGLYPLGEQQQLAAGLPRATFKTIISSDGHDGFLLETEQINAFIDEFLRKELPTIVANCSH